MRMILRVCILVFAFAGQALADDITAGRFLEDYSKADRAEKDRLEQLLVATERGLAMANVYIRGTTHQPPIYCLPESFVTGAQLKSAMEIIVKRNPEELRYAWPNVLFFTLRQTFPCQ